MSTQSKEAMEASGSTVRSLGITEEDRGLLATIIDRHFAPLRRRAEQAEARVKELEAICENEIAHSKHLLTRIPELNAANAELETLLASEKATRNAIIAKGIEIERANAELQKQEAESRRLFYAEQDKRQSAEFRCEEMAGALREVASLLSKNVKDFGGCDHSVGVCMCEEIRACDNAAEVLARHAAGEPEAQK